MRYSTGRALWPSERGLRIGLQRLDSRFAAYRDAVGLDPALEFHSLRRSYITHLIEDGHDPLFVQHQVGHDHASTTAIYTCVSSDFRARSDCDNEPTDSSHIAPSHQRAGRRPVRAGTWYRRATANGTGPPGHLDALTPHRRAVVQLDDLRVDDRFERRVVVGKLRERKLFRSRWTTHV